MWPIGHISGAYILYTAIARAHGDTVSVQAGGVARTGGVVFVLGFGALFPDLVDKPLGWYLGVLPAGRTLAHSLLFLIPFCAILFLLARRYGRPEYGVAFAVGALSHAVLDAVPALWGAASPNSLLWPLLVVEPYPGGPPTILGLLRSSLSEPYFLFEFVLLAIAFAAWRSDGYPGLAFVRAVVER